MYLWAAYLHHIDLRQRSSIGRRKILVGASLYLQAWGQAKMLPINTSHWGINFLSCPMNTPWFEASCWLPCESRVLMQGSSRPTATTECLVTSRPDTRKASSTQKCGWTCLMASSWSVLLQQTITMVLQRVLPHASDSCDSLVGSVPAFKLILAPVY